MKKLLLVLVVVLFASSAAFAAAGSTCKMCGNLKSDDTSKVWGARFCSGLCNGLLGWTEIFFRPGKVVAAGGNGMVGFFKGLGYAVERTVGGALEVVTFWTPAPSVAIIEDCPLCAYK